MAAMAPNDGYRWDVFVSYPREGHHLTWIDDIFVGDFMLHLRQELGREPQIFIDRQEITTGDAWKLRLKSELARSKILIPIWSVDYFLSEPCKGECAVILHRETRLGIRTAQNPSGLIVPIRLYDGERYPEFAKQIQYRDFTAYNLTGEYFKKSARFLDFQTEIQAWMPDVASRVQAAPAWSPEWTTREWLDIPFDNANADDRLRIVAIDFQVPTMARE